jgi:hypothetical protein
MNVSREEIEGNDEVCAYWKWYYDFVDYVNDYFKNIVEVTENGSLEEILTYFGEFDRGANKILEGKGGFSSLPYIADLVSRGLIPEKKR